MFSRLSKLFGSKKTSATPTSTPKEPEDPRFQYVNYGSLRLRQVTDQATLATLSDSEVSKMIDSWSVQFANLDMHHDYLVNLFKDIETLHTVRNADLSILGPIHSISYKTTSDDSDIETDFTLVNPDTSSDIKIKIVSDIQIFNDRSSRDIEITAKDVLVLKTSIYGDFDRFTNVSHLIPGGWLSKFMPFLEHDFAHNVSNLVTTKRQAAISDELNQYAQWANSAGGIATDIKINNIVFPVPVVHPKKTRETHLEEFEELRNEWRNGLKGLCVNSFNLFNLENVLSRTDDPTILKLLTSLNLKSIKTEGLDHDVNLENPFADSGLELIYSVNSDVDYDFQKVELFQNGNRVLSVYSDYGSLGITHITPGSWMETFGPMLVNDFAKLQGIAKNIGTSGLSVDDRTIASTMFDV